MTETQELGDGETGNRLVLRFLLGLADKRVHVPVAEATEVEDGIGVRFVHVETQDPNAADKPTDFVPLFTSTEAADRSGLPAEIACAVPKLVDLGELLAADQWVVLDPPEPMIAIPLGQLIGLLS